MSFLGDCSYFHSLVFCRLHILIRIPFFLKGRLVENLTKAEIKLLAIAKKTTDKQMKFFKLAPWLFLVVALLSLIVVVRRMNVGLPIEFQLMATLFYLLFATTLHSSNVYRSLIRKISASSN